MKFDRKQWLAIKPRADLANSFKAEIRQPANSTTHTDENIQQSLYYPLFPYFTRSSKITRHFSEFFWVLCLLKCIDAS